jgi:transmembrane sensor
MDSTSEHTTDTRANSRRRAARAEASAWIVRLHGPHRTADLEAGFRAWLAANPENTRQFERVTEVWDAGATPVPGVARVGHWQTDSRRSPARGWLLAAAVAIVFIGAGFWSADYFWLNPTYATGIGEQRIVRLSDGTRITLNSNSRVAINYRDVERRVRIDRGEAYFDVAKDASRPFLVRAGVHEVAALGTTFDVRYEALRTAVTLVEGKVSVSSLPAASTIFERLDAAARAPLAAVDQTVLAPGQRLVFAKSEAPKLDEPRIEAITAWRRGEVMLDKTALAEAIAEMNRYDQTTLVIDDATIAQLEVSGIYHTADNENFAAMISRLYGLEVIHREDRIHLTTANAPASN